MVVKQRIDPVFVNHTHRKYLFEKAIRVLWHYLVQLIGQLGLADNVSNEGNG